MQGPKGPAGWTTTTWWAASTTRWRLARDQSRPAQPRRPPTTRRISRHFPQPQEEPACWWCLSPSTLPRWVWLGLRSGLHLWYSDGSHGRGWWSWLLSSSYQWRREEIPMQNVSTGRNCLPQFYMSRREGYLERLKSGLGILRLRYFNSNWIIPP